MAENGEGRMARWSRLKHEGGASPDEDAAAEAEAAAKLEAQARNQAQARGSETSTEVGFAEDNGMTLPDPTLLPGGVQKRNFVPAMAPLAGAEDGDTAYEAPPEEALAMLAGETPHNPLTTDDLTERELTPDEEEAVRDLPPLESLTQESDFTPFLADNIPEFIRNRALKILWRSNPLFGFQDGLDDYAENFRVIDKLITAATDSIYRPGKGYAVMEEDLDDEESLDAETKNEDAEAGQNTELSEPETSDGGQSADSNEEQSDVASRKSGDDDEIEDAGIDEDDDDEVGDAEDGPDELA